MRKQPKNHIIALFLLLSCLFADNSAVLAKNYSKEASQKYNEAVYAYRSRRFTLAKQCLNEIIEKYPDDGFADMSRSILATLLRDMKEYDKSIEIFKEIISKTSNITEKDKAKQDLADVFYTIHRYREGIELLESWIKEEPNNVDLIRKLAQFHLQTGEKDEAWLLLERCIDRGQSEAFSDLLNLAIRTGEVDNLLNSLESRRSRFKASEYFSYVADCYLALGRKDKAIEVITENKDYDKDTSILRKLVDIQISDNKLDDAIKNLEKLCEYLPKDWQCNRKLGHCYFLKNDKQKAVETWKKQLGYYHGNMQEKYMNYVAVLIEHQLLEEALEAFKLARKDLRQDTIFAEEKAAVLEALGRKSEAMEENLNVLAQGIYKTEIFDKLYKSDVEGFSLENRLQEMNSCDFNQAITKALIEFYFRKARISDIDKMVALVDDSSGIFFDDLFYNRLKQESLLVPEQFHFDLMKKMMVKRAGTELELKLASLMLKMPDYSEKWLSEAYELAKNAANSKIIADANLKYNLYYKLAEFAFKTLNKPEEANEFLGNILKRNIINPSKSIILEAKLLRSRIYTYMSDFPSAEDSLNDVGSLLEHVDYSGELTVSEQDDFVMLHKLEVARLKSHMGQYQEALDSLKVIVEKHKEGEWVNDALELALEITRFSLGDFGVINHKLKSERLAACGKNKEAVIELNEAIKALPASSTALLCELETDKIILEQTDNDYSEASKVINGFIAKYPENPRLEDIYELKIKLMQSSNQSYDLINEEMRSFILRFPYDLRSGKYKLYLENGGHK